MFEKLSRMAEQAATSVSRRQFLGRFGRATALSVAAGALLAQSAIAGPPSKVCGTGSDGACTGLNVGDHCSTPLGSGTCRRASHGSTTCLCARH